MILKKQISQITASALLVASYGISLSVAHAENTVIGMLQPQGSVTLNAGSPTAHVMTSETPYISGDVVSTAGDKGATLIGANGDVITLSADSKLAVNGITPLSVTLIEGAFKFSSGANSTTSIDTPSGIFRVTSDQFAEGVALYQNGEFAVKSVSGSFTVENDLDSSVTKLDEQNAVVFADGSTQVLDVFKGTNNPTLLKLIGAAALIGGAVYIADDNDPTSP